MTVNLEEVPTSIVMHLFLDHYLNAAMLDSRLAEMRQSNGGQLPVSVEAAALCGKFTQGTNNLRIVMWELDRRFAFNIKKERVQLKRDLLELGKDVSLDEVSSWSEDEVKKVSYWLSFTQAVIACALPFALAPGLPDVLKKLSPTPEVTISPPLEISLSLISLGLRALSDSLGY
jgi:hypothetical protein